MVLASKVASSLHRLRRSSPGAFALSLLFTLFAVSCRDMMVDPGDRAPMPRAPLRDVSYGAGWTAAGPGTSSAFAGPAGSVTLSYHFDAPSSEPASSWSFAATATQTTTLSFEWVYDGFHGWFADQATLQVWADGPAGTTTVTLLNTPACEGDGGCAPGEIDGPFTRTGTAAIQLTAGQSWGFTVSGSNGDCCAALQGTVYILPQVSDPLSAHGTASVDGSWAAGEWDSAAAKPVLVNLASGGRAIGAVYVMNDASDLYLGFRWPQGAPEPGNSLAFEFDNDNDGVVEAGDDIILYNASAGLFDDFRQPCNVGMCAPQDTQDGGTNDGAGVFFHGGGYSHYEMSKPLNSADDAHDFSLVAGDIVGYFLNLRMIAAGAQYPQGFGDTRFPATGYGTIQIAGTPAPTTGTLVGTVKNAAGAPLPGVAVHVAASNLSATTNTNGQYQIGNIPQGQQTVTVLAPGYQVYSAQVNIPAGATATHDIVLQEALHTLSVTVTGSPPVAGITVSATNVANGDEFYVTCTDASGVATFQLPAANYVVHARNLPICNTSLMQEWPYPNETTVLNTAHTANVNHVGVIFQVSNGGSLVLNPANYKSMVQAPLGLGAGGSTSISLQFQQGATIQCSLLNSAGQPFTMANTEHFYTVQPFGDETGLPPISPASNPKGLPRGIATVLATIPQGQRSDNCSVSGVPAGSYVLETNAVVVTDASGNPTGEVVTYRESVTVTEQQASSGSTVQVVAEPEPLRASTGYLLEDLGDARASAGDLGLVTYGWGVNAARTAVTDTFAVAADFQGLGTYTLEMTTSKGQSISATAVCDAKGCKLLPREPKNLLDRVRVGGVTLVNRGKAGGTVVWKVSLPELVAGDMVFFRIYSGDRNNPGDVAPASGTQQAVRPSMPDDGNSWAIAGT